jgi:hypothetical protein
MGTTKVLRYWTIWVPIFLFINTVTTVVAAEDVSTTATKNRMWLREGSGFPSALKIDRFSKSWPQSSASFMADLLERATARESLQQQQQSKTPRRRSVADTTPAATSGTFPSPKTKKATTFTKSGGTATIPEHTLYVLLTIAMFVVGQQELLALTCAVLLFVLLLCIIPFCDGVGDKYCGNTVESISTNPQTNGATTTSMNSVRHTTCQWTRTVTPTVT